MGDVVDLMPRIRSRDYESAWNDVVDGKAGSIVRVRNLIAIDPAFKEYCERRYREHMDAMHSRYAEEDGA